MKSQIIHLPDTLHRVTQHTNATLNQSIENRSYRALAQEEQSDHEAMTRRIANLDHEWDTERVLEITSSSLILLGLLLGSARHPRWYGLSILVGGFLVEHALQGWCPPLPVIRRLGVRSPQEIAEERMALKLMRGDVGSASSPEAAWQAARI
jgi:hypothetical protein